MGNPNLNGTGKSTLQFFCFRFSQKPTPIKDGIKETTRASILLF